MNKMKKIILGMLLSGGAASSLVTPLYAENLNVKQNLQSFVEDAQLTLKRESTLKLGEANKDGGVAEIVSYSSKKGYAYVVNGQSGKLDIAKVKNGKLELYKSVDVKTILEAKLENFAYGDMTSVSVDDINGRIAVAIQEEAYNKNGKLVVLDYEGNYITSYEAGVQPDMITFADNGNLILSANEGEPREGYKDDMSNDPKGSVTIVDTKTNTVTHAGFDNFTAEELLQNQVLLGKVKNKTISPSTDLEPEYISVSPAQDKAYITLQEANAIAELDLHTKTITKVKGLGLKDLSKEENAIDLQEDGQYGPKTYDALAAYMPDAISSYEYNGKTYLVIANEGDAREWGDDYCNEVRIKKKDNLKDVYKDIEDARILDSDVTAGIPSDKPVLFGGRSFAILDAENMSIVYDSNNDFEENTARFLPEQFNVSNDKIELENRTMKKGPEPESVTTAQIGKEMYAFIGIERTGGVMVYNVTNPKEAKFVNYMNSRDFSTDLGEDNSPEGLTIIPAKDSDTKKPILLAACAVSGNLVSYSIDGKDVAYNPYQDVIDKIENAKAGETIDVNELKEGHILDASILEAAKGKDVNIHAVYKDIEIMFHGKDILNTKDFALDYDLNTEKENVTFAFQNVLPGKISVKLYTENVFQLTEVNKEVLFTNNGVAGSLKLLENGKVEISFTADEKKPIVISYENTQQDNTNVSEDNTQQDKDNGNVVDDKKEEDKQSVEETPKTGVLFHPAAWSSFMGAAAAAMLYTRKKLKK